MSKRLKITKRGKIVISASLILIVLSGASAILFLNNKTYENHADEVYSYSISSMLSVAKENEMNSRQKLREQISSANSLVRETDGKVFDVSRTNLQSYVSNISEIPDSQIIESDNIIDYINSEMRINSFRKELSEKQEALQSSYDAWNKSRTELDENMGELSEEINNDTSAAEVLEQTIQENIKESERIKEERERQQREEEERRRQNRQQPVIPSAPVIPPEKTTDPETPVEPESETMPEIPETPETPDITPPEETTEPESDEETLNNTIGQENG